MFPFVISTDANVDFSIVQYKYHSYYYDSYVNYEGYSIYITGASDEEALILEAHFTCIHTTAYCMQHIYAFCVYTIKIKGDLLW